MNIAEFIKHALIFSDEQKDNNKKYLDNTILLHKLNKIVEKNTNEIITNIHWEVLGVFHPETQVFIWGWMLPYLSQDEIKISKELLDYGLKLTPQTNTLEHFYLKTILVNSRIYIENDFDLELIVSIAAYLLKDKCNFIYPFPYPHENDKTIIIAYYTIVLK